MHCKNIQRIKTFFYRILYTSCFNSSYEEELGSTTLPPFESWPSGLLSGLFSLFKLAWLWFWPWVLGLSVWFGLSLFSLGICWLVWLAWVSSSTGTSSFGSSATCSSDLLVSEVPPTTVVFLSSTSFASSTSGISFFLAKEERWDGALHKKNFYLVSFVFQLFYLRCF